jgi:hypothetical protein
VFGYANANATETLELTEQLLKLKYINKILIHLNLNWKRTADGKTAAKGNSHKCAVLRVIYGWKFGNVEINKYKQ